MITGRRASREAMQKYAAGMLGLTPLRRCPRADHDPAREPIGRVVVAAWLGQALIAWGRPVDGAGLLGEVMAVSRHKSVAYKTIDVQRDTQFGINTGSPAFLLDDSDGESWCMKSASLIVDPSQTYESLKDLVSRLTPPPGWKFRAVVLEQDLILTPDEGAAKITQDELGNTYDRAGGAYSNYKP